MMEWEDTIRTNKSYDVIHAFAIFSASGQLYNYSYKGNYTIFGLVAFSPLGVGRGKKVASLLVFIIALSNCTAKFTMALRSFHLAAPWKTWIWRQLQCTTGIAEITELFVCIKYGVVESPLLKSVVHVRNKLTAKAKSILRQPICNTFPKKYSSINNEQIYSLTPPTNCSIYLIKDDTYVCTSISWQSSFRYLNNCV